MDDASRTQFNDEEDKKRAKPEVVGLEEIACPDVRSVILQKGSPRLGGLSRRGSGADLMDVTSDGAFGQMKTKLAQFILNAFGSPQPVVERHRVDERDDFGSDAWWTVFRFRLVSPEQAKTLPMPTEQGVGLDDEQGISPRPQLTGEQDKHTSIEGCERRTLCLAP